MKTLFEQIAHWKAIGEWQDIKKWYVQSDTYERYCDWDPFIERDEGSEKEPSYVWNIASDGTIKKP